jgi:tetratricopeptide (TPR) repeat protein
VKAWNNRGVVLAELERYSDAITSHDEAIRLNPKHVRAGYNKGGALSFLSRYEEAIQAFDRAIQLDPKNEKASGPKKRLKEKLKPQEMILWGKVSNKFIIQREAK